MFGYKITKNGKTICIGVSDALSEALNRLPSGQYKVKNKTVDENQRKRVFYTCDLGAYSSVSKALHDPDITIEQFVSAENWVCEVIYDVPDIIDILFEEVKSIWNKS